MSTPLVSTPDTPATLGSGTDAEDTAALVLRQFRQVFRAVKTHFQQVEKRAGLGGAQVWALSTIGQQPGVGMGGLARAMDIHQSTASNLVRGLAARSMVEVRREGADRRAVQLHLLPAGAEVLRRAPQPFTGVLPDALQRLDQRTLQRLHRDLGRLIEEIGEDAQAGQVPLAMVDNAPRRRRAAAGAD